MIEPLIPMQPVQIDEPFDDPNWTFQVKWDGVRMLAYVEQGDYRLVNRRLRERTAIYPELQILPQAVRARSLVLDGEVVALGADGKPSFSHTLRRDLVKNEGKIRLVTRQIPVYFMVFDVLYLDDKWLVDEPLSFRQARLQEILSGDFPAVKRVDDFASGKALFRFMQEQGMEGIVCKEKSGRYRIGEYSATWKKVKNFRFLDAVVGGATYNGGRVNSLMLGCYQEGRLLYIGKAGSGLNHDAIGALTQFAKTIKQQPCPFAVPPRLTGIAADERVWFPPQLVVRVKFLEWTADLTLRSPVIQHFVERDPKSCQL